MNVYEKIMEKADALAPAMTTLRRDLHKHAETGWLEMRTSSILARKLTELGYEVLEAELLKNSEFYNTVFLHEE